MGGCHGRCGRGLRCRGRKGGISGNAPDQIGVCMLPSCKFDVTRNNRVSSKEYPDQKVPTKIISFHRLSQFHVRVLF